MNFFVKGEDLKRTEMFYIHTLRAFIISISNCFDHFNIILNNIFTIKRVPMLQMPAYRGNNTKKKIFIRSVYSFKHKRNSANQNNYIN